MLQKPWARTAVQGHDPAQLEVQVQRELLQALRVREITLRETNAELQAQIPVLEKALESARGSRREGIEADLLRLNTSLATTQSQLTSVVEQIQAQGGGQSSAPVVVVDSRPVPFIDRIDNDVITAMFVVSCLVVLVPLAVGLLRRAWRLPVQQSLPAAPFDDLKSRMERMEQAVDAVALEVERVAEGQRFVSKVLMEHSQRSALDDIAASGRALGAGAMEAIPIGERAGERQPLKRSITPH